MRLFLVLTFLVSPFSLAQKEYIDGATYDPTIPKPADILGYDIGERFTDFRNLEKYFDALVGSSNRITRVVYGTTYEHRPLQVFIISAPVNLERLEAIRSENLKLTDPRTISATDAMKSLATAPAIAWLSYGVHGNESSSPEAAMMTAYQLCAGTDSRTLAMLDSMVMIIDPNVNPDGRERYVRWANGIAGKKPDPNPDAVEHREPWPGGRTNHYYFDLNRDWSWMSQRETRERIALYRTWMPHVHVDFHEMGYRSSYFFFPATAPLHSEFPESVKYWGALYGKGNAEALDKFGIPYYTAESFDLFYPGYGDSWPTFNGAIGMTYEQAGHSMAGLAIRKPGGKVLLLRDRARNHFLTGMATLNTTLQHRLDRLQDFFDFWRSALKPNGRVRSYIIPEGPDPARTARMVAVLMNQGIEVHRFSKSVTIDARRFFSGRTSSVRFPEGTYGVSLEQPHRRLANALLEPEAAVRDTFFYDVSAWSLPVAYGLTAFSSESTLPSPATKLSEIPLVKGRVDGAPARVAYLIPWDRHDAAKAAWFLLDQGISLSYASRSFTFDGREFRPGTLIAFVSANPESLHNVVQRAVEQYSLEIFSAQSSLSDKGVNLGSNHVRPVHNSRIAVLSDTPVNPTDYGELWFMFDREYEIPFSSLRTTDLAGIDLTKYDVLVFPDGRYRGVLDSSTIAGVKDWVAKGGVLIGIENGARFMTKSQSGITSVLLETDKKGDDKEKDKSDQERVEKEKRQTMLEKEESDRLKRIPGTIFKALVDTTHPIGFGYEREAYVLKGDGPSLLLSEKTHTVVRFAPDDPRVSGYSSKERTDKVADSGYILDFTSGKGHVILAGENLTFRMFWTGYHKMLLNAILFLPEPK